MTYLWRGIHHHFLKVLKVCVWLNKALKSTVWHLPDHTGFLCESMRWTRWKWQAAISSSPSLQTAPSTTEPAFTLQQSQHSGGRCGPVFKSREAFCSLYESNNLTAVLFQTNDIKDNQIKRSCWLPPPANGDLYGWTWESYRDKQWHSLIDGVLKINSLVTSGGSRLDLLFLSICPSLPTVSTYVRSRIYRRLHLD